jgi:hypothetical protein
VLIVVLVLAMANLACCYPTGLSCVKVCNRTARNTPTCG